MLNITSTKLLIDFVSKNLTPDDDPRFWETALTVLADEFMQRFRQEPSNKKWIFQVGVCSHWVRPQNSCWPAAGGFAYPQGYNNSMPEFDWDVVLGYDDQLWTLLRRPPGKKTVVFRVAVPARSARHKQAAIHTKWSTSDQPVFYGFRNLNGTWKCVAASDERLHGPVTLSVKKTTNLHAKIRLRLRYEP